MIDEETLAALSAKSDQLGQAGDWSDRAYDVNSHLVELDPHCLVAYTRLARCLRERGDTDGAAEMYRRVLDIDPYNVLARNQLAGIEQPTIVSAKKTRPTTFGKATVVTSEDTVKFEAACRSLPPVSTVLHVEHEYLVDVFLTVLDLRMRNQTAEKMTSFYQRRRASKVQSLGDLAQVLDGYANDREGNMSAARYLWGNNHWIRVQWLRGLVRFLTERNLSNRERLQAWAVSSDFKRDFEGRVPYLSIAAYQWLRMRLGVDTVKPDTHLHAYASDAIGHALTDLALIDLVTTTAHALGMTARDLDGRIWEWQRGGPGTI